MFADFLSWCYAHSTVLSLAAFYLFSAAVGNMEMPGPNDSKFYRWSFGFLNQIAANWARAKASRNQP